MSEFFSVLQLADVVNGWCAKHRVAPANGQAGEQITVRNIRYYRSLGLVDPPASGGQGFGEKHRLQLIGIRLLQAQGLPLNRVQQLLYGRTIEDLRRIERQGLEEIAQDPLRKPQPWNNEFWSVMPLGQEFLLVSRRGRPVSAEIRERLLAVLGQEPEHGVVRDDERKSTCNNER